MLVIQPNILSPRTTWCALKPVYLWLLLRLISECWLPLKSLFCFTSTTLQAFSYGSLVLHLIHLRIGLVHPSISQCILLNNVLLLQHLCVMPGCVLHWSRRRLRRDL